MKVDVVTCAKEARRIFNFNILNDSNLKMTAVCLERYLSFLYILGYECSLNGASDSSCLCSLGLMCGATVGFGTILLCSTRLWLQGSRLNIV